MSMEMSEKEAWKRLNNKKKLLQKPISLMLDFAPSQSATPEM